MKMKKLISIILVCATMLSILAMMPVNAASFPSGRTTGDNSSAPTNPYSALKTDTAPTIDGVIGDDEEWSSARKAKLDHLISSDNIYGDNAPADTNDVSFSVMWDAKKIYILIEIWDDEYYPSYSSSKDWNNDRVFLYFSENAHDNEFTKSSLKSTGKVLQLDLPLGDDELTTVNLRNGVYGGNDTAAGLTVPAIQRATTMTAASEAEGTGKENRITIELALTIQQTTLQTCFQRTGELGTIDLFESLTASIDVQYHDVDKAGIEHSGNDSNKNSRVSCVNWHTTKNSDGAGVYTEISPSVNPRHWGRLLLTDEFDILKASPVVDGKVDSIWNGVSAQTIGNVVTINNESRDPSKADNSNVTFKTLYDDNKVYFLFEILDNEYASYLAEDGISNPEGWADWKDDSIIMILSEQEDYVVDASYYTNVNNKEWTTNFELADYNMYMIAVFPSDKGAYVRSSNAGNSENVNIEHSYTLSEDKTSMVIELSLELKNVTNQAGTKLWADFQYNDANPEYDVSGNTRDVVKNWMSGYQGTTDNRVLGQFKMSDEMAYVSTSDAALKYYTASLGDKIGMNYYMQLSKEVAEDPATKMNFEVAGVQQNPVSIADAVKVNKGGTDYYVFTCNVAAKQMTDVIKAQLETTGGTTKTYSYTVAQYANYIIGHTDDYAAKEIELAQALLNYGAEAQLRFNYNTENLATADPTFEEVPDEIRSYVKTTDGTVAGVDSLGTKAVLESAMALRYYFAFAGVTEGYTFKYGNTVLELKEDDDGYYVEVPKIVAKHYDETYTVTVTKDGDTMTVTTSVYAYIADILADAETYADSQEVAKALYWYNVAANNYFG